MAWNFRKRITILPGLRINLNGKGVSVSIGARGSSINISKKGITGNASIPWLGIYKRETLFSSKGKRKKSNKAQCHYSYPPVSSSVDLPTKPNRKPDPEQRVKIDTLLKYRSVIKDSKVALLEDLKSEGKTHVMVPGGEIEALSKLQADNSEIKRIVSFKVCE